MQGNYMEHFTSFYADFGIVKQANKQLKRLQEGKGGTGVGEVARTSALREKYPESFEQIPRDTVKNEVNQNVGDNRRFRRTLDRQTDPLTKPVNLSYDFPRVKAEAKLPTKDFTEIRKTGDTAASESGYLGFRTDPYKGYGGMMEEAIPKTEIYPNGEMYPRKKYYKSRLTEKVIKNDDLKTYW